MKSEIMNCNDRSIRSDTYIWYLPTQKELRREPMYLFGNLIPDQKFFLELFEVGNPINQLNMNQIFSTFN